MSYGIAAYKVTSGFCNNEVDFITSLGGIQIKYNHELGRNISLEQLQQQYDAIFLGIGVGLANPLHIPGENTEGVENAIDFIYNIRDKGYHHVPVGEKVVVIGMGMTAIDAATQAKRLGAKEVTMIYRRTESEKGCTQAELDIARLDGCKIIWLASPKEIIANNGKLTALVCDVMKLGAPDYSGRPASVPTGHTITIETDMVIKATGQQPFEELVNQYEIENKKGKLVINDNHSTNRRKLFAGGDCVNGGKEVVDAVQAGKKAASSILAYLADSNL